jgi:NTP pyrophosphatase (non-canonical NTP hydrolase)
MLVDDYADWAATIRGTHGGSDPQTAEMSYLGLGLAGECGEVVELVKKLLRDGKLDSDHLCEELGDVAYYWARLCVAAGKSPSEILDRSQAKIDARLAESGVRRQDKT